MTVDLKKMNAADEATAEKAADSDRFRGSLCSGLTVGSGRGA
jgi:hypothetical protein